MWSSIYLYSSISFRLHSFSLSVFFFLFLPLSARLPRFAAMCLLSAVFACTRSYGPRKTRYLTKSNCELFCLHPKPPSILHDFSFLFLHSARSFRAITRYNMFTLGARRVRVYSMLLETEPKTYGCPCPVCEWALYFFLRHRVLLLLVGFFLFLYLSLSKLWACASCIQRDAIILCCVLCRVLPTNTIAPSRYNL